MPVHAAGQAPVPARLPQARPPLQGACARSATGSSPARHVLGDPDAAGKAARAERRPRQRDEPGRGPPLVHGEDPGHPPRQAAARLRLGRRSRRGPTAPDADRARRRAARRCCSRPATSRTTSPRSAATPSRCCEQNGVDVRCAAAWSAAGCPPGKRRPRPAAGSAPAATWSVLSPSSRQGAKVLAINPTCSMMLRREYPTLVAAADRPRAAQLAAAVRGPERVPVVDARGAALQHRLQEHARRARRLPRALPPARPGGRLPRPRPHPQDPGRRRRRGDGMLRPRRHLRHEGGGLRALAADRRQGVRRHAGARAPTIWVTDCPLAAHPVRAARRRRSRCTRCRCWPAPTGATPSRGPSLRNRTRDRRPRSLRHRSPSLGERFCSG